MRLKDYLQNDLILLDIKASSSSEAIRMIVSGMAEKKILADEEKFLHQVLERENLGSTGIGNGIALPHARTENISNIVIAMARLSEEVDWQSEDGQPVKFVFLIGTPLQAVAEYLQVLARLSRLFKEKPIRKKLAQATTINQIMEIFADSND